MPVRVESSAVALVRVERARQWGTWLGRSGLIAFTAIVGGVGAVPGFSWLSLAAVGVAAVGLVTRLSATPRQGARRAPGTAIVDAGRLALVLDGSPGADVSLDQVAAGWTEDPDRVVVGLRDGTRLEMQIDDPAQALGFLHELGVAPGDRVLRVPIYGWAGAMPAGELVLVLVLLFLVPLLLGLLVALSVALWGLARDPSVEHLGFPLAAVSMTALTAFAVRALIRLIARREVVVGTDGIIVEGVGRPVFVPLGAIESVSHDSQEVTLQRRGARSLRLPTARTDRAFPTAADADAATRSATLAARIRASIEIARAGDAVADRMALLDRRDRSLTEWQRQLDALASSEGDYRRPSLPRADLLALVGKGSEHAGRRVAAAYVVCRMSGDARVDVERAAQATADPALARALAVAADGSLDERSLALATKRYRVEPPADVEQSGDDVDRPADAVKVSATRPR